MAVVAPDETALTATGWLALDSTNRYFRHEARYGPAVFDLHEVAVLESGKGRRHGPRRVQACRCQLPFGRREERICWKCGRRVP